MPVSGIPRTWLFSYAKNVTLEKSSFLCMATQVASRLQLFEAKP
jgi:hypothetical protein